MTSELQKFITANLNYGVDTGVKPVNETIVENNSETKFTGRTEEHLVKVYNARIASRDFSLDRQGFKFWEQGTLVNNFDDPEQIKNIYYPETESLVKQLSGAIRVVIFDHTLRSGDENERKTRQIREPVHRVHNDFTEWSGPQRVKDILPDEANELLEKRFAIIQTWRPIRNKVENDPLAICEAETLASSDLIKTERRYPNRIGETYQVSFNPKHRWYYFPAMNPNELLVFKVYDSETDGRARFTAHTAFQHPNGSSKLIPRESIETRCLAFF